MDIDKIDLEMACKMTGCYFQDKWPLTYKSNRFNSIIDFDVLAKIKPPKGYGIGIFSRDITVETSTFRGMCIEAVHYYCTIKFEGPSIMEGDSILCGYIKGVKDVGRIIGGQHINLNRPVTKDDLNQKHSDWEGYAVGDMTHRWNTTGEAIEAALRVIPLRFRNYGKVFVDDEERGYYEAEVIEKKGTEK